LLFDNISEGSVHHHLATVEPNYFGIYQEHHINKYQKCTANHELRLSCAGTAAVCFFDTRRRSEILSEPSTFTAGKELPVEVWKGSWVGLTESVCKQRKRKELCPYWERKAASPIAQSVA